MYISLFFCFCLVDSCILSPLGVSGASDSRGFKFKIMPLLTFDKVLKIISTILNILSAALNAFGSSFGVPSESNVDEEGHA